MVNSGYSKEEMNKYMKEYVKNSQSINCKCGGKYKSYNKYIHLKSKKHKKYSDNNDLQMYNKVNNIIFDEDLKSKFIEFLNKK